LSIAVKAARGAAWNMITGLGARGLGMVGTLILTRFISPNDYGEVSAASICVMTASMFTNLNFGQYVIAVKATAEECFTAWTIHVLLGVLGLGAVVLLGNRLGGVFDAPTMGRFVPGLALAAMLDRTAYLAERTLVRDLEFRRVSTVRALGEVLFTSTAVGLAPRWSGMAIVIASLARSSLTCTLYIVSSNRREWLTPVRLRWDATVRLLRYSIPISIGTLADFASARWDNLLVSRFYGPGVMAEYNLAYNLADTPNLQVAEAMGDVFLPAFARLDRDKQKEGLYRASALMALTVFPLAVGLGVVAPTLVSVLFDRKWQQIAPMLSVLAVLSIARPLSWTVVSFVQAQRKPRALMMMGLSKLSALVLLLCTIGRISPLWACAAAAMAFGIYSCGNLYVASRQGVQVSKLLLGASGPLAACAVMAGAVLLARSGFQQLPSAGRFTRLGGEVLIGALVYVAAAFVLARRSVDELLGLLRRTVERKRAAA
jgi:PST family polysaccharide transporter